MSKENPPTINTASATASDPFENTIRALYHNKPSGPTKDLTVQTLQDGRTVKTTDRIIKRVPAITNLKPTDAQVFHADTGLPNIPFLKDHFLREGRLSSDQVLKILDMANGIFAKEANLLEVQSPITICGDIHGQYYDLIKLFEVGGDPSTTPYLFLGDYVDRGMYSIECLLYLYAIKITYPTTFFMLRGNHECRHLTSYFTFKTECLHKYSRDIYNAVCNSFNHLPLAALMNGQYFCVHGGISPDLQTPHDVNRIDRFREPPTRGLFCDLLWSDPLENYDEELDGAAFTPNDLRGCSYAYSFKAVSSFLQRNNLLSVIRAHEVQDAGYRMYRKSDTTGFPTLLTLFSAPNYTDTYKNKGAILKYGSNTMNIRQFNFSPHPYHLPDYKDVFTWSLPFVAEKVTDILVSVLNICTEEELDEELSVNEVKRIERIHDQITVEMYDDEENDQYQDAKESVVASPIKTKLPELPTAEAAEGDTEDESDPQIVIKRALRNKILAIGRVSRMFAILRAESENVDKLKSLHGGTLPRGLLLGGSESIKEQLTFEQARTADLDNEKLPPSLETMSKRRLRESEKEDQMRKQIDESVRTDRGLQTLARRYSNSIIKK
ncbi:hypothetical protein WICPIJ_005319 [Wickerhamomyces pijperi]|uniref:Serine/threonine-protein phosphatase n=1 Tax=Wickerhamomyces pijperi TaxID=599730 RepID=A0A9P8Q5X7_WICPI|nr:hypothetical protein WICPIJ_005319 [Wickerhamomyces pijperi]